MTDDDDAFEAALEAKPRRDAVLAWLNDMGPEPADLGVRPGLEVAIEVELATLEARANENGGALAGAELDRLFDLARLAAADDTATPPALREAPPPSSVYDAAFGAGMLRALLELGPHADATLAVPAARSALVARIDERARIVEDLADEAALARARKVPT